MTFDAEKLLHKKFPTIQQSYTDKDCMLYALLKSGCDYEPSRFKRMRLRFSAPVYPGETIRTEICRNGNETAFRCKSLEQDKVVINNGYLLLD